MHLIEKLMIEAFNKHASDLLITVGARPTVRVLGKLLPIEANFLTLEDTEQFLKYLANDIQYQEFLEKGEIDFSYGIIGLSRFRINAYKQRGTVSLAIRIIPTEIPSMEELGLPSILRSLSEKTQGLILVTGPTGSGKSTTLASIVDHINQNQEKHIITLEDPIEYLHKHKNSIIDQREIGIDSTDFVTALKASLRQDPDIILVGELQDLETIATAITAAESGHLILATLQTVNAVNTIDRLINIFPTNRQAQIRVQLASVLISIISQRLIPTVKGNRRTAAIEILINSSAVSNLIRSEKIQEIKTVIQTGKGYGMQSMEMAVKHLVDQGLVSEEIGKQYILKN